MKIKLFFLGLMSIGSVYAQDAEPRDVIKSVLKAPSQKYNIYGDVYLGSRLDTDLLELEDLSDLPAYLENLVNHDTYSEFMNGTEQLQELDPTTSDELRYHIMITWAEENERSTWDAQKFFPTLSTDAVEHVYLPLGRLLLNDFRVGDPSRTILIDLCLDSLHNYKDTMVPNIPFCHQEKNSPKTFNYNPALLLDVCTVTKFLPTIKKPKKGQKLRFVDGTKTHDGQTNGVRRIDLNSEFRTQSDKNNTIDAFCLEQYAKMSESERMKYNSPKDALTDLYPRYSVLYDFLFESEAVNDPNIWFIRHSPGTAMLRYKTAFDQAWAEIQDIEHLNQEELAEQLYPEIKKQEYKLRPQLTRTRSYHNLADDNLFDCDSYSSMPEDNDDSITTLTEQLHGASSQQKVLPLPLLSVNGQLVDLDQQSLDR